MLPPGGQDTQGGGQDTPGYLDPRGSSYPGGQDKLLHRHQTKLFMRVSLIKHSHLSVTLSASILTSGLFLLQCQILRRDFVDFFQLTRCFMCKISKADIKYTDTKTSGYAILYFDVYIAFYVFICFSYSPLNPSWKWCFLFSVHGPERQYDIQNNSFRKRLENTQKFAFDFVAFLVSLSIP